MNGVDYYQLLSLSPTATVDELKAQYRRLSLTYHPDRGGSTQQMAVLNEAYRVLSNPLLRREYDRRVRQAGAAPDEYHYTRATPRPPAPTAPVSQTPRQFWRWFMVLSALGVALLVYDVMATVVMPRYLTELPTDANSTSFTPSGDLTDEAASALSEFYDGSSNGMQRGQRP